MSLWKEKGCPVCRSQWESGSPPPQIAVNITLHISLHLCEVCGAYWEQAERYATTITVEQARAMFPDTNI